MQVVLLSLSGAVLFCLSAVSSSSQDHPYTGIVERNVFNLRAPAPPAAPEPPKPPPSKIILHGVTSILGRWQVLGKVQIPARPPEPAKETLFNLGAGEREGEIEVLSIDGGTGTVKLKNSGVEQILTMDKDTLKSTGTPAPATAGQRGAPTHAVPPSLPSIPRPPEVGGRPPLPTRNVRPSPIPGTPNPSADSVIAAPNQTVIPNNQSVIVGQPPATTAPAVPQLPQLTPQQQAERAALIERLKAERAAGVRLPPPIPQNQPAENDAQQP